LNFTVYLINQPLDNQSFIRSIADDKSSNKAVRHQESRRDEQDSQATGALMALQRDLLLPLKLHEKSIN